MTKDHIIPQSQIKINNIENIALVCQHCNTSKSNKNIYTWRDTLNYQQQIIINKYLDINLPNPNRQRADRYIQRET